MATSTRRSAVSAGDPVLESKITAPGLPDWVVPRPRITKQIAQGTRWCPLTVVTGPPGSGKTVALALWAAAEPGAVAWVCLDGYDNRPGFFWSYVVAALRGSGVALPGELPVAVRRQTPDHVFLLRLAATLAAQDPPVTLVLDDFHLVTDPTVLDGLDFVLRNAGSGLRLAVASRMDPRLPVHRYRLAGQLTEIRASDLAFSLAEASLLLARQGCALSSDALECLTRRMEGWAAGLRLAALSMDPHPDSGQFVTDQVCEDSALTGYLVDEVLNAQPPQAREVLLCTSILDQVNAEAAIELTGHEQAAGILRATADAIAFVQPTRAGWYRYHTVFAEVLRLRLQCEHPGRMAALHRRAARWCERSGLLADAVRHAAQAGDWELAAGMVTDGLAISQIIEPWGNKRLAEEFRNMPLSGSWAGPQPHLVRAAVALSRGQHDLCAAALAAADGILDRLPGDLEPECRLAAALIRLAASRRSGDLQAAVAAADHAQALVSRVQGDRLAENHDIRARLLCARGAVELWSDHLDEAAQVLDSGAALATVSGMAHERANCLGHLALLEAVRGRLGHAAELAAQATGIPVVGKQRPPDRYPDSAALTALAWVHLEHHELREARSLLKQVDASLDVSPDKLIGAVACLLVAYGALAEGSPEVAARFVVKARSSWSVPAWLEQRLNLVQSRASVAVGDIRAALAAAEQAARDDPLEAAPALARAWAAAGDGENARRALAPVLTAQGGVPKRVRLQAWLVDAQLSYDNGDRARGHRSLASAMRLAEREQLRLPFAMERGWLWQVLRRDPELASTHQRLLASALAPPGQLSSSPDRPAGAATPVLVEPLTEREREVLRNVSRMMNTAEVASEMYISINTVKTHIKSIHRKLATARRSEAVRRARELQLI